MSQGGLIGCDGPLAKYVGKTIERSLTFYLDTCTPHEATPAPEQTLISLAQAEEGIPYSQEYLSLLAQKGRPEAIKRSRLRLTTRKR